MENVGAQMTVAGGKLKGMNYTPPLRKHHALPSIDHLLSEQCHMYFQTKIEDILVQQLLLIDNHVTRA